MKSRLQIAREAARMPVQDVASKLGISEDEYTMLESGVTPTDEIVTRLAGLFCVDAKYFLGYKYELTRFPSWCAKKYKTASAENRWYKAQEEDCLKFEHRSYWECRHGKPVYIDQQENPVHNGELSPGMTIFHRNGKIVEKKFSKEQIEIINSMPEKKYE